jgi:nucleoside-diphosphate-sugar epimerase
MRRALVTGASGFVGRHAAAALEARGYEVHAVTRRSRADTGAGDVRWHSGDLLDRAHTERLLRAVAPSHLLHLAWYAEPGLYWESPENDRWRRASVDLLRAFAAAGGRRAVVAGTCAEYDWAAETEAMSERRTPLAPRGAYGAAKNALRRDLERWSAETGSSSAWARLFFLFGPAEDPRRLVPSVARALLSGRPAEMSTGRQVRDFLLSSEAAAAMAALLDGEVTGPVNVGSGYGVSVRRLVELVGEAAGRSDLLRMGALPDRADEPPRVVADARRLQHEVGWGPSGELVAWVEETVGWWRRRLAG